MARRIVQDDALCLAPDPTRRARMLRDARYLVSLNSRTDRPGHVHPMTAKYQPIVDALETDGPVILRSDQLVGLRWAEKLPDDHLWRVDTDGAVTPYDPKESSR